jgi:hypothetical protein
VTGPFLDHLRIAVGVILYLKLALNLTKNSKWFEQMPYDGRLVTYMERPQDLLIELVSAGRAGMLALMLHPAFDDEGLDYSSWLSDVFPNVPADCAVTLPY